MSEHEDLKIFLEDFTDFLNGLVDLAVRLRRQIEKLYGVAGLPKSQQQPNR